MSFMKARTLYPRAWHRTGILSTLHNICDKLLKNREALSGSSIWYLTWVLKDEYNFNRQKKGGKARGVKKQQRKETMYLKASGPLGHLHCCTLGVLDSQGYCPVLKEL